MANKNISRVFSAEWHRTVTTSRTVGYIVFSVLSVLSFLGTMALLHWGIDTLGAESLTRFLGNFIGFDIPALILAFMSGLYCAGNVARDHEDGTVPASGIAVPNRILLFFARLIPWIVLPLVAGLFVEVIVWIFSMGDVHDIPWALANGALCLLIPIASTLLAFSAATIMKRGGSAVFLYLLFWYLLPLMFGAVEGIGPEPVQVLISTVNTWMPGTAVPEITSLVSDGGGKGMDNAIFETVISAIWVFGGLGAALRFFRKSGMLPG